jgi:hypothetical protein
VFRAALDLLGPEATAAVAHLTRIRGHLAAGDPVARADQILATLRAALDKILATLRVALDKIDPLLATARDVAAGSPAARARSAGCSTTPSSPRSPWAST